MLIRFREGQKDHTNGVECDTIETHSRVQSLDIIVECPGFNRRYLCHVKFIENNTFRIFPSQNSAHKEDYSF